MGYNFACRNTHLLFPDVCLPIGLPVIVLLY